MGDVGWHMRKTPIILFLLTAFVLFGACAQSVGGDSVVDRALLKLVDGSTISQATTDDYSPIIVRLSNGYLALVFGSTRACALSCSSHNVFVSSSVTAYSDNGVLPAFHQPQPFVMNGFSPLNYATRPRLAVVASGTNITVYLQLLGSQIMTSDPINPVSGSAINLSTGPYVINDNYCYLNNLLGIDANGLMIAANTAGTQTYRFNPSVPNMPCPTAGMTNSKLATGSHISAMRQASTGIADAFIVSDAQGNASAQSVTSNGSQMLQLKATLASYGLVTTGISVFQSANPAGDLVTFSAAPSAGASSDLYVMTFPTPQQLWSRYVQFGQQPQP